MWATITSLNSRTSSVDGGDVEVVADPLQQPLGVGLGVGVEGGDVQPVGQARRAAGCVANSRGSGTTPPLGWRPDGAGGQRRGGTRTAA